MSKKLSRIIKFILFPVIFYLLCWVVVFLFRDDADSYSRVVMHDLQTQDRIDILFCGASHINNGILPSVADEKLGVSTFCAGTPAQKLTETYAVIQAAAAIYDLKEIFLEMDFEEVIGTPETSKNESYMSRFLAINYLQNPKIKFKHIIETTLPSWYLNELLPIGQYKLIDLDPRVFLKNLKSKLSGDYYKYVFVDKTEGHKKGSLSMGKGCFFYDDRVENGTYKSRIESPIRVNEIHENFKNVIRKTMRFCEENKIKLVFYAQQYSDFLLCEKGNYDEYHMYIKEFLKSEGYDFYDFNLCKGDFLSLEDCDFYDRDHFSSSGIIKFTDAFCEFYKSNNKSDFFHKTYEEKILAQEPKILGLMYSESSNKKSLEIFPVLNHGDDSKILYSVYANNNDGKKEVLFEKSASNVINYPENSSGDIEIYAYYDGAEHCHITMPFVSM